MVYARCWYGVYCGLCKLGVLFVGVLIIRALLLGVYVTAPDFWKPPFKGLIGG